MYNACAHGFYYLDEEGMKADAWCWLFTFEDFKVSINITYIRDIFVKSKVIEYMKYTFRCLKK